MQNEAASDRSRRDVTRRGRTVVFSPMPVNNPSPPEQRPAAILRPLKRPRDGPLGAQNRRGLKRYLVPLILCQVLAPSLADDTAHVVDLSAHGICLSLKDRVPLGAVLHLRLCNREQLCLHDVRVQVTHCRGGEGYCLAGGMFETELTFDLLRALMG
jgi:hypothetical protein